MTTIEAQLLSSGDEVGKGYKGYHFGIVMEATPRAVAIFWDYQKMHETTSYMRSSTELREMVLKRKAPLKKADLRAEKNHSPVAGRRSATA